MTPTEALEKLKLGHDRFMHGECMPQNDSFLIHDLAERGQHPFAVVVTCSDSRVAPEIIFNCRLGDLFTIRTAGNVISEIEIGSIEYAVNHLHVSLVLVLGHRHCGAVACLCSHDDHGAVTEGLHSIFQFIQPSVDKAHSLAQSEGEVAAIAEDLNVLAVVDRIAKDDALPKDIKICGAKYDIETGNVIFISRARGGVRSA